MTDTIAAIATARAPAAIGIVRISGPETLAVVDGVFAACSGKSAAALPHRRMVYGHMRTAEGAVIDDGLCVIFRPGEQLYRRVVGGAALPRVCSGAGGGAAQRLHIRRPAGQGGEFTRRAFLSGRMDLIQAEAVADLIDAETAECAQNAALQLSGSISRGVEQVYDGLMDVTARFYAAVDYPDEDIEPLEQREIADTLSRCRRQLQRLLDTFRRGRILREGIPTVLLGLPNAGKSSLLNALLGYDRAIVTEVAGTTRDTVEEKVRLGGQMLRLCDTAGIRDARDSVEKIGVDRAVAAAERASLSLVVLDGSVPLTGTEERIFALAQQAEHSLLLVNKSDLPRQAELAGLADRFDGVCSVCARTGEGVEQIGRLVQAPLPAGGSH